MTSIPKCKCGNVSSNKEVFQGPNRGRWFWKCGRNLCGFFEWNTPGESTYTFTPYTIPNRPKRFPFTKTSASNEHVDRSILDLGNIENSSPSLVSLGSGNDKRPTPRSRSKRQRELTTVELALYTNTDISVHAHGRHSYLQSLFHTIPGIAWMDEPRLWVFSADQQTYQQVWQLLYQHRATFQTIGIPKVILRCLPKTAQLLQEQLQQYQQSPDNGIENDNTLCDLLYDFDFDFDFDIDNDDDNNDDDRYMNYHDDTDRNATDNGKISTNWNLEERIGASTLWQEMTEKQRCGLKKIIDMEGHVYLQDPAGSGNSLQALGTTLVLRNNWPTLIICRESVCQKWNSLIQDMLLLEQHQISLLDHIPLYNGKVVYSDSPKATQSRLRQRTQEKLKRQKQEQTAATVPSSTGHSSPLKISKASSTHVGKKSMASKGKNTTRNYGRKKDDWWIEIMEDIRDVPPSIINSSNQTVEHVRYTKKKDRSKKKRKLQKGEIYIRLINTSGDYYSDMETADSDDDDFMDNDNDNDNGPGNKPLKDDATETNDPTNPTLNEIERNGDNERNNQANTGAANFFIMSYDKAKTKLGALSVNEFKMIIFDDCHDLNGTLLPTYKSSLQNLVNASKKTIMVSDVPILPKPMESFPLLQILKPSMFVDYKFFGHRYCGAKQNVFGWHYTGLSNSFELEYLLNKTVLVA